MRRRLTFALCLSFAYCSDRTCLLVMWLVSCPTVGASVPGSLFRFLLSFLCSIILTGTLGAPSSPCLFNSPFSLDYSKCEPFRASHSVIYLAKTGLGRSAVKAVLTRERQFTERTKNYTILANFHNILIQLQNASFDADLYLIFEKANRSRPGIKERHRRLPTPCMPPWTILDHIKEPS